MAQKISVLAARRGVIFNMFARLFLGLRNTMLTFNVVLHGRHPQTQPAQIPFAVPKDFYIETADRYFRTFNFNRIIHMFI